MYREHITNPMARQQMVEACEVLRDWAKYKPAIAGGCLWAWAANKPARDVDIFVRNSRRARKKASSYILVAEGSQLKKKVVKSGYWSTEEAKPIKAVAYTSELPTGSPIDLILTPYSGIGASSYFDYSHCMVAFSVDKVDTTGIRFYVSGTLQQNHKEARSEKVIMDKIQKSLWGTPNAETMMKRVICELKRITNGKIPIS